MSNTNKKQDTEAEAQAGEWVDPTQEVYEREAAAAKAAQAERPMAERPQDQKPEG